MFAKLMRSPHIRFMTDVFVGLAVFSGLTVALLGPSCAASLLPLGLDHSAHMLSTPPPAALTAHAIQHASGPNSLLILLAAVFSTLFALNLSFIRHIASAYRVAKRPVQANKRISASTTKSD